MKASMKRLVLAACAAMLALGLPSVNAQDKSTKNETTAKKSGALAKDDLQALRKFAQADMAEIEAGKVAAQKASSPEVKKYGEHMVQEHMKMLDEGKKLAQAKGVKPPAGPEKKHQDALKKLQGAEGEDFDRRYMRQMVRDHQEVLKLAEKTARDAKDPALKAHAEKGLPHIKEHLESARNIEGSLAKAGGGQERKQSKKQ
jgi:putative membrane protein